MTRYQPSERIKELWDRAQRQPDEMFLPMFRDYYYLEGWMAARNEPLPIRNAAGLCSVIERMPLLISPGEIIVGESGDHQCDHMINFQPSVPPAYRDRVMSSALTDEQKSRMTSWLEKSPFASQDLATVPMPSELALAQQRGVVQVWGTELNHSIRGYEKVLRLGFSGLKAEVESALSADPQCANLLAFKMICESAEKIGLRHAEIAHDQKIAQICERVPAQPARTFLEAVQSLWFAHILTVWEDGINANGIGRIDQFLWPYLERDLADGTITTSDAMEILAALWIKLYRPYDVQQMMIGGQHPDGSDAVNPLSYLVLDVTEALGFIRCLSARLHRKSPREFVSRCVDLVAKGGGIPFFFNDEALVPALVSRGIPLEDARGYAAIGCIEITIPGKANPHAVSHWINLPKCLELAINDGRDLLDGAQVGPQTGMLADFHSIDDVLAAYTKQLEYFAKLAVEGSNACEIAHRSQFRLPYLSLLTDDCVARGLDIIEGGARYNYHSSAAMGIPNVADSLAALQTAVFEDEIIAPDDMLIALRTNFAGREDLRLFLRNRLPKYGNDEPLPDGFAADIAEQYCDLLARYRTPSGGTFFCHLFTFVLMLSCGKLTGASPEGRLAGEPLAYSVSPVQGRDRTGLTAAIKSLARIPHHLAAASSSAILEADPALLDGPSRKAFVDLMVTAIDLGVGQLQFNVVSEETLKAAQDDPEAYQNLCVRVSGFSQQFCLLDRELQNHIIARTKHTK
ncbi:MAG TPA: pyruvate formate lyase family protein [Armatimonadota bacterium]|nr:pyruvate formate lyase family protein [Armatimonadota bacterium]